MSGNQTQEQSGQEKQWQPNLAKPKQEPLLRGSVGALGAASVGNSSKQISAVPENASNVLDTNGISEKRVIKSGSTLRTGSEAATMAAIAVAFSAGVVTLGYFTSSTVRGFINNLIGRQEEANTGLPERGEQMPQAAEAHGVGGSSRPFRQPTAQVHPGRRPRRSNTASTTTTTAEVGMGGGVQLPNFRSPMATEATMPQGVPVQSTGVGQPGPGVQFRMG